MTEYKSGRPAVPPSKKVGWPIRFLVTPPLDDLCNAIAKRMGLTTKSDLQRLALYRFLEAQGEMTPELREDPTWNNLKDAGLV